MVIQTIQGVKRRLYAITITSQQKKQIISKEQLDEVIKWLTCSGMIIANINYEDIGKHKQLHVHAFAWVKMPFFWRAYIQYGCTSVMDTTFQIHWQKVLNVRNILRYMEKQTHGNKIKQSQIIQCNPWYHHDL